MSPHLSFVDYLANIDFCVTPSCYFKTGFKKPRVSWFSMLCAVSRFSGGDVALLFRRVLIAAEIQFFF